MPLALKAATPAASEAESAARQQQDEDDDEKDREHGHLSRPDRLGAFIATRARCFDCVL